MDHDYKITRNDLAKTRESQKKKMATKQRKRGAVAKHLYLLPLAELTVQCCNQKSTVQWAFFPCNVTNLSLISCHQHFHQRSLLSQYF